MSDSTRPHRQQPTRLPHPWDSPGKNTAVGCHFLLQCMKVKSESAVTQSCPTLSEPMDCGPPGSSVHGIFQARVLEWGVIAFSDPWSYSQLNFLVYSLCIRMLYFTLFFTQVALFVSISMLLNVFYVVLLAIILSEHFYS